MQTSGVFSERTWPGVDPHPGDGVPDIDDCWVLSAYQCVNVVAPWLYLPPVPVFRKAAGDPDDGKHDGGSIAEITQGVRVLYPEFIGKLDALRNVSWTRLRDELQAGRPVSVALSLGVLPKRLRYTTSAVPHQSTLVVKPNGKWLFANPMAPMMSRWDEIDPGDVRPAILDYGHGGVFGVAFPTDDSMAPHYPPVSRIIDREAVRRSGELIAAAKGAGFADAKAKAGAAVDGIKP